MPVASKQRILLVDDEPQVLVALEDLLSDKFFILKASSAEVALRTIDDDDEIAVVLSDQRMPRMNGDEFLGRLGEMHDSQRILVTGYADLSAVIRAVNEGHIFAYVTKPWNPEDLRNKVFKAAERYRLAKELAVERKLLQEQTQLLNSILNGIGDGVVAADTQGKFLVFNPAAERILGRSAEGSSLHDWAETAGIFEIDEKTPLSADHNPLWQAMNGRSSEAELHIHNEQVQSASVTMAATPLMGANENPVGGIALLRDVTERRLLESQLLQSQKMEAIGQLASGVAHDFNNLLVIIQNYGELFLEELPQNDPMREDMSELLGATHRAASLTKQLLAFSRHQPMRTVAIDLNALVVNLEKMLRRVLGGGVELVTELKDNLGPIQGDVSQIEQIILNLVINARDAMPTGGRLCIETNLATSANLPDGVGADGFEGPFAALIVRDTGSGIPADVQKRIFEPFFTTKEIGKGTGLGLSTVYGIVRQSGGHITVASTPGRGTTFSIYLPLHRPRSEQPRALSTRALGYETILIVETEETVLRAAVRILQERGYRVLEARSVAEAKRLLSRHVNELALIIADGALGEPMGVRSGGRSFVDDLLSSVLTQDSNTKDDMGRSRAHPSVLYLLGNPTRGPKSLTPSGSAPAAVGESDPVLPTDQQRAALVGQEPAFLTKPFTPAELVAAVRQLLADAAN